MPAPWDSFDYAAIKKSAEEKLDQAKKQGKYGDHATLEYWIAWVTHANAINTFSNQSFSDTDEDQFWRFQMGSALMQSDKKR